MAPYDKVSVVATSDRVLRSSRTTKQISYYKPTSQPAAAKLPKKAHGSRKVKQQPKQQTRSERIHLLTKMRQKKIENFIKYFLTQPRKDHGSFGSTQWIHGLIEYMKESKKNRITEQVVRRWMQRTNFFEETLKKMMSRLPRELPTPVCTTPEYSSFSSSSTEESSLSSDGECFIRATKVANGKRLPPNFLEPLTKKLDWNDSSKFIEDDHESSPSEANSDPDINREIDGRTPSSSNSSADKDGAEQESQYLTGIPDGGGESVSPIKQKMFRKISNGQKAVVSIFPGGFEWKGTFGQPSNGSRLTCNTTSSDSKSCQQQIPEQQLCESPRVAKKTCLEHEEETPSGTFVARIPLGNACCAEPLTNELPYTDSREHEEKLDNLSTNNSTDETVLMMNQPDINGNHLPSFYTAEDIIVALINNGLLVLHTGDPVTEPDNSNPAPNDVTLLQLHTNKILQIAAQNAGQSQDHACPGFNWEAALHCGSLLNFIAKKQL